MVYSLAMVSLMLTMSIPSTRSFTSARLIHPTFYHDTTPILAGRDLFETSTTPVSPSCDSGSCSTFPSRASPACDAVNGTEIVGNATTWTLLCDIDFFAQNIFPFILTTSFEGCMQYCEEYNGNNDDDKCVGFVFAPDRAHLDNDCYLKSGMNNPIYPASIHLIGATLHSPSSTSTMYSPPSQSTPTATLTSTESIVTPPRLSPTTTHRAQPEAASPDPDDEPASKGSIPIVAKLTFLGTSVDKEATQYVRHSLAKPQQLAADLLQEKVNLDLITGYPLASDTGSWTATNVNKDGLADMTITPRISRDGGRGGNINGTNVFIFCDTSTYGQVEDPVLGYLNGFVSSSVAIDYTMNALNGNSLELITTLGQWQDDVGRLRGWVPMTTGEEAFNIAVSGQGYRYAVWPNSSPISLNSTHSVIYAPLVYLQVDMQDQSSPSYTGLGNTILLISIDPTYGPHANRLHNQFFTQDEVSWGSLGGIRSWTSKGQEEENGRIYVFGQATGGVLVGRVDVQNFDNRDVYTYWNGEYWSNEMPPLDSTSNAYLIEQPVMNMDLIYSPAHKTFIMIYLTPDADNTFYFRYLSSKDNSSLTIIPPNEHDGDENYMEHLVLNTWSNSKILFRISEPERGYAYAGGIHAGYFGTDDITKGGTKMLCTWTEHTKIDPNKPESGYAHKSQIVEFGMQEW